MTLIEWKSHYSVGVEAVDHEHRELIDLINELHESLVADAAQPDVTAFLGEIFRGISAHFALEERFMREHGYDQFDEHKQAHEQLLENIRDIMDGYDADPEGSSRQLSRRLDAWFTLHFKTHDARLHHRLGVHGHR
ncbi:hemerythrin-like metal-binding protein [Pseudaminobacter arsenicus]|uniref:Hemerythrin-like metal-binding protein n=1 Tax=Borborobacter arsenicus TaxID=1851146 RepID=A0A432UZ72_9HYPH|nr:bacteriohemerythrin [Pseudaminobacter arsenicus]RUM95191.1 hemerythrin-like metal-binding protein [Pseudaminobacter arsenicus]